MSPSPDYAAALQAALGKAGAGTLLEAIAKGPEVAFVGGWVRDTLLGRPSGDVDLCTAHPAALLAELKAAGARKVICLDTQHEVWRVVLPGGRFVDVGALKGDTLEADLRERDLTINAIAWVPGRGLVDPLGGAQDLEAGVLRLASPGALDDDPLRCLRVVRFATQLRSWPSPELLQSMRQADLSAVALERIQRELAATLRAGAMFGAELLESADLLRTLPPCNPGRLAEAEGLDWSAASLARLRAQMALEADADLALHLGFLLDGPLELAELLQRRWPRRLASRALALANTPLEAGESAAQSTDLQRARDLVRWRGDAAFVLAAYAVRGGEAAVAPYLALLDDAPGHRNPKNLPVPPLPRPMVAAGKIQRVLGSGPQVSAAIDDLLVLQLTGQVCEGDAARAWLAKL